MSEKQNPKGAPSLSTDDIGLADPENGTAASIHQSNVDMDVTGAGDDKLKPEAAAAGQKGGKDGSRVLSVGSRSSSQTAEHRFAREISETLSSRLREMKWCFLALGANIAMLIAVEQFKAGSVVSLSKDTAATWEGIVMELLLLVTNIFTIMGMDAGTAAFFGFQMATKGRSMAVIGFSQAPALFKMSYANDLSLNSSVRKILNRLSFLWGIMEILKLLTPVGASAMSSEAVRSDAFTVDCIAFGQIGRPVDRMWPNVEAEIGFAELIFGKSIGRLRSEEDVPITEAIIGPQVCHCGVCVCRSDSDLYCFVNRSPLLIMMNPPDPVSPLIPRQS